jgi:hypothetical protein
MKTSPYAPVGRQEFLRFSTVQLRRDAARSVYLRVIFLIISRARQADPYFLSECTWQSRFAIRSKSKMPLRRVGEMRTLREGNRETSDQIIETNCLK